MFFSLIFSCSSMAIRSLGKFLLARFIKNPFHIFSLLRSIRVAPDTPTTRRRNHRYASSCSATLALTRIALTHEKRYEMGS